MIISASDIFADLRELSDQLDLDLDGVEVSESTSMEDDLGMDSLSMMDFLIFLEKKYEVTISNEKLRDVASISDVVTVINQIRDADADVVGLAVRTGADA